MNSHFDDDPSNEGVSLQLSLFGKFISNDKRGLSNTVEGWDTIPKYFFNAPMVKRLRNADGLAGSYKWPFQLNGRDCTIRIQPAQIEDSEGNEKAFFPGVTEELVEEALKKIMTDPCNASHDPTSTETWVKFSLRMVHRELKSRGRQRNIKQIKDAIDVMSGSVLTLFVEGQEVWKGAILQDLITVGREDYLADTDSLHVARLPLFVSQAINNFKYRQINFVRLMALNEPLSRWLLRKMSTNYINANSTNTYHFLYSSLTGSALLQGMPKANRRKIISALDELVASDTITSYDIDTRYNKRTIVDVKYTVTPSRGFIRDQIAANKRDKTHKAMAKRVALKLPVN